MFARCRSVVYADPFAHDRKERSHDHRAEEEPDQSKCSPAENSYQCQQERQPRRASDERRLNEVITDQHHRCTETENSQGRQ
jgi:hypothetical protein